MRKKGLLWAWSLAVGLWVVNVVWLLHDTRPPVWDMAMHQTYALNYLPGASETQRALLPFWTRSGTYPPLVHLAIAFFYLVFHPGPHIAVLANIPATFLLFWAIHELASGHAGEGAAMWACTLTALVPYLIWMSRETVLDYWLSALVAASLVLLRRTRGFESHSASLLFGGSLALGLLTKWLFAGFLLFPILYVSIEHEVWRQRKRLLHLADAFIVAAAISGIWYVPNLPGLARFFGANARIGAREGEPPVLSFQSLIYYLRLLEGYQLFALLFVLTCLACIFVFKRRMLRNSGFLLSAIAGGWFVMSLLRTKDARFTMPLLGMIMIIPAVWIHDWDRWWGRAAKVMIVAALCIQAYAANFGIPSLPEKVVIAEGYQGSLRWDWNLYLQDLGNVVGPPRREDWKQGEILQRIALAVADNREPASLAVVPDLARFSAANFTLAARLAGMRMRIDHPQSAVGGIRSFDGYNYVLATAGDQGMPWTTASSQALNRIIADEQGVFRLLGSYPLPNGDCARLYFIRRDQSSAG